MTGEEARAFADEWIAVWNSTILTESTIVGWIVSRREKLAPFNSGLSGSGCCAAVLHILCCVSNKLPGTMSEVRGQCKVLRKCARALALEHCASDAPVSLLAAVVRRPCGRRQANRAIQVAEPLRG